MSDDTSANELPEAFTSNDPGTDDAEGRVGTGRVIEGDAPSNPDAEADDVVEEASEDSFPGSDATPFRGSPD